LSYTRGHVIVKPWSGWSDSNRRFLSHPCVIIDSMTTQDLRRWARCQQWLPLEDFNFRDKTQRLRQSYCRSCSRLNWREWYAVPKNKAHHIEVLETRRRRLRQKNREYVRQLKKQPCTDCGGRFPPEVMDFDHLGNKSALISKLVYQAGWETLLAELAKCEVVCANCHRIRTMTRNSDTANRSGPIL
jgi:hypothetical protein